MLILFLPAAGRREDVQVGHDGLVIEYWACKADKEKNRAIYYDGTGFKFYSVTEYSLPVRLASVVSELA